MFWVPFRNVEEDKMVRFWKLVLVVLCVGSLGITDVYVTNADCTVFIQQTCPGSTTTPTACGNLMPPNSGYALCGYSFQTKATLYNYRVPRSALPGETGSTNYWESTTSWIDCAQKRFCSQSTYDPTTGNPMCEASSTDVWSSYQKEKAYDQSGVCTVSYGGGYGN